MEFAKEASQFQYVLGEVWDHSAASNYLYLFVCAIVCSLFIIFFKPSTWNVRQAFENVYTAAILSYTDCWCLVPFCINIYGNSPHRMYLCFDFRNTLIYGSLNDTVLCRGWGGIRELGTQQENSYTKYAITNRLLLTATLGRVNEASRWNFL